MNFQETTPTPGLSLRHSRRAILMGTAASVGAALLAACGGDAAPATPTAPPTPAGTIAPAKPVIGGATTTVPVSSTAQPVASSGAAMASPGTGTVAGSTVATTGTLPMVAPLPAGKTIDITFSHVWATAPGTTPDKRHPVELVIEAFNAKNTGVKVTSRVDSTDYYEVLQKAQAELAAGKPPALVATPWSNIIFADCALGITSLETLGGSEVGSVLANLKTPAINLARLNGSTKGLPFALSCPVVYYNNDTFKAAGVNPAEAFKDWATFAQVAPQLKAKTGNPVLSVGTNPDWPAQSLIQSNGGRVLDDNNQPAFDRPEAVEALNTIASLGKVGLWLKATTQEAAAAFTGGSLACYVGSIASLGSLRNSVMFDLGVAPFPRFGQTPRLMSSGGSFIGCYARDKDQQRGAWEFFKFVASQEGMTIWLKTGYLNATTFTVPQLPGQDAAYTQLNEGLTRETAWPGKRGAEVQKVWGTYVSRIWSNDIAADVGTRQAKADIMPLLSASC